MPLQMAASKRANKQATTGCFCGVECPPKRAEIQECVGDLDGNVVCEGCTLKEKNDGGVCGEGDWWEVQGKESADE